MSRSSLQYFHIGRTLRLHDQDRKDWYSQSIGSTVDDTYRKKMIKPYAYVILPMYNIPLALESSENIKGIVEQMRTIGIDMTEAINFRVWDASGLTTTEHPDLKRATTVA